MGSGEKRRHFVLVDNGVEGACSAALLLMKHPNACIQFTSSRHIATALAEYSAQPGGRILHVCGIGISPPVEDTLQVLSRAVEPSSILWYSGNKHPELLEHEKALAAHCTLAVSDTPSDSMAIAGHLGLLKVVRTLLLLELAEDARLGHRPRSEYHRFCRDLVLAANHRFYFFGDDSLNEKAIRYLAEQEQDVRALEAVVDEYRGSADVLYPLGSSGAMKELRCRVGRIGPVPEPVLIVGPTGSGKEVMAKALHVTSGRKGAFVPVNCAVLGGNPTMVEDRLFGHVKGAYTGATADGRGAFEEAHGGTLFLDEVGELPAEVQSQLLRVLEEKAVRPLGTMTTRRVDVRIVAATHRALGNMVGTGAFREDLYYRLNVLTVRVPSLRERPEDMRSIAAHVLQELAKAGYPLTLAKNDWVTLQGFDWPGNVRQFLNVLKRAAYLGKPIPEILEEERVSRQERTRGGIDEMLSLYCPDSPEDVSSADVVYRAYLKHVLELFGGNITRTAQRLRIAPNTLRKHLERM